MPQQSTSALATCVALSAGGLFGICFPAYAFITFHPTNCAGCHGNRPILATPTNGGMLTFGNNGNTLVGQTTSGSFTIKNNHVNLATNGNEPLKKGGGFTGSFSGVANGAEFGPTTSAALNTGTVVPNTSIFYLTPQQQASRTYTYTPQQRSLGVFDTTTASFTTTNGFSSNTTVTINLQGKGVAPQITLITTSTNAGNILVGNTGTSSLTVQNVGDGNLSGQGDVSNLKGSFGAGAGLFSGASVAFNLLDGGSQVKSYTFTPVTRITSATQNVNVNTSNGSTNGQNQAQAFTAQLSGRGVAPVANLITTGVNAGNVLVGMSGTSSLTVQNTGDGNLSGQGAASNLNGTFAGGSSLFSATGSGFSLADNTSQEKQYTFLPVSRGTFNLDVNVNTTNGHSSGSNLAQTLPAQISGKGVAPVISLDTSQADAGNVRIGTSGPAKLTVQNTGDGNLSGLGASSNLNGSLGEGSGVFTGAGTAFSLADGESQLRQYSFMPVSHGTANLNLNVSASNGNSEGSNLAQVLPVQLTGTGVGPKFASSIAVNSIIDFGSVSAPSTLPLSLFNDTSDPELGLLTLLTLLSFNISGADANLFSLQSFSAGTQLGKGASLALGIGFSGVGAPGPHSAMLSFVTDEGAALGVDGNVFAYSLQGTVIAAVPEATPAQMLGAGLVCMGLLLMRKRRMEKGARLNF